MSGYETVVVWILGSYPQLQSVPSARYGFHQVGTRMFCVSFAASVLSWIRVSATCASFPFLL